MLLNLNFNQQTMASELTDGAKKKIHLSYYCVNMSQDTPILYTRNGGSPGRGGISTTKNLENQGGLAIILDDELATFEQNKCCKDYA